MDRNKKPAARTTEQTGLENDSGAKYIKTIRPNTKEFTMLGALVVGRSLNRIDMEVAA